MTERHGDNAAVEMIDRYIEMGQKSLVGKSYLLERTGDQLLIVSEDADDLAGTAIELKYKTEKEPHFSVFIAGCIMARWSNKMVIYSAQWSILPQG